MRLRFDCDDLTGGDNAIEVAGGTGEVSDGAPPRTAQPFESMGSSVYDDLDILAQGGFTIDTDGGGHAEPDHNAPAVPLRSADAYDRKMQSIAEAAAALEGRERILLFTGAGISTESGIPDFRGPNGVWKTVDPKNFTLRHYVSNQEFRRERWQHRFGGDRPAWKPNSAHRAAAALWDTGRMIGCITQNIDGLHVDGGLPETAVAEVHGNPRGIMCVDRGHRADVGDVRRRWEAGELDPRCDCGSILKSTVVMFGEQLPFSATHLAEGFSARADAAIAVGSTISVYPAAEYLLSVADRRLPLVIVNMGPTDADSLATVRLEGKAGELLPALVDELEQQAQ